LKLEGHTQADNKKNGKYIPTLRHGEKAPNQSSKLRQLAIRLQSFQTGLLANHACGASESGRDAGWPAAASYPYFIQLA
jgi:hypothetical protein